MNLTLDQDRRLAALMESAQQGDAPKYESLLAEVAMLVRAFLQARGVLSHCLEDLVQETLISIHRARHTFDSRKPFGPWLFAIAQHRLVDSWRQLARGSRDLRNYAEHVSVNGSSRMSDELVQRAIEVLANLNPNQRLAIELLKFEGLSVKEAAYRMSMREAALKVTAHRGYEQLRRRLGVKRYDD